MSIRTWSRHNPKATTALVPAALRPTELLSTEERELNAEAVETFTKAVGGRDQLVEVLSVASMAPEVDRVVTLLLDPRYQDWSLRRLCLQSGITVAQLFASYKKALITRAHLEATATIAAKLPPIVDDVMTMARTDPTVERQKLALELGQLTTKGGGIVVQQNAMAVAQAAAVSTGTGALEQLQQAVGDLLFSPTRTPHPPAEPLAEPLAEPIEPGRYDPPRVDEEDDAPSEEDVPLPFADPPAAQD